MMLIDYQEATPSDPQEDTIDAMQSIEDEIKYNEAIDREATDKDYDD